LTSGVVDTGVKSPAGVIDTRDKFTAGVVDTSGTANVSAIKMNLGKDVTAGVVDSANFREKKSK
jgi:hypothetical protein